MTVWTTHPRPLAERLLEKLRIRDIEDCWLWIALAKTDFGYGRISRGGGKGSKLVSAHVAAWELTFGRVPRGWFVLHSCDVPACCNPLHLFLGTAQDNSDDMVAKGRHRPAPLPGEANPAALLTAVEVITIRMRAAAGASRKDLAAEFGVCRSSINQIVTRKTWTSV